MIVPSRFKAARNRQRLSQVEMAKLLGVKQQAISAIENGKSEIPRELAKMAKLLNVTQAWLLGEDENVEIPTKERSFSHINRLYILSKKQIIRFANSGALPLKSKKIMIPFVKSDPNHKISLFDISNEAFVNSFFKTKMPRSNIYAIVDSSKTPAVFDVVLTSCDGENIRIQQYLSDGEKYYFQSFDDVSEKVLEENTKVIGVMVGHFIK